MTQPYMNLSFSLMWLGFCLWQGQQQMGKKIGEYSHMDGQGSGFCAFTEPSGLEMHGDEIKTFPGIGRRCFFLTLWRARAGHQTLAPPVLIPCARREQYYTTSITRLDPQPSDDIDSTASSPFYPSLPHPMPPPPPPRHCATRPRINNRSASCHRRRHFSKP